MGFQPTAAKATGACMIVVGLLVNTATGRRYPDYPDTRKVLTAIPAATTSYGSELIKFTGFDGNLQTDYEVTCTFEVPADAYMPQYREVRGKVLDPQTVACVAPLLLVDRDLVTVYVTTQGKQYVAILWIGTQQQRKNALNVQIVNGDILLTYDKYLYSNMSYKYVALYEVAVNAHTGKAYADFMKTFHITKDSSEKVKMSQGSEVGKSSKPGKQYEQYGSEIIVYQLIPAQNENPYPWDKAIERAGVVPYAVSDAANAAIIESTMYPNVEQAKKMCYEYLKKPYVCQPDIPDVYPCPPTLERAQSDARYQPYPPELTQLVTRAYACYFYTGYAKNGHHQLQQCCYGRDKKILCGSPDGGTPIMYNPTTEQGMHVVADLRPRMYCCKLSNFDAQLCEEYFKCRPNYNCGYGWHPPSTSGTYGDPHYTTFDGAKYDFMGYGEYWLIKNEKVKLQGRMFTMQGASYTVTSLAAVAFQCGSSRYQVEYDLKAGYGQKLDLLVYYNGEPYFVQPGTADLYLGPGMTVSYGPVNESSTYSILPISLHCADVKVYIEYAVYQYSGTCMKYLNVRTSANCRSKDLGKFEGLYGICNGDPADDFVPRGVNEPVITSDDPYKHLKDIYYKYGETWRITENESLFYYEASGLTYDYWNNPPANYTPSFEAPDPNSFPKEVQDACKTSIGCYVDYDATKYLELAQATREEEEYIQQINEELNRPVPL